MLATSSRNAVRTSQASTHLTRIPASFHAGHAAKQLRHISAQATAPATTSAQRTPFARSRTGVWTTAPNTSFRDLSRQTTPVARYNLELSRFVSRRQSPEAFALCRKMKQEGVRPDQVTYDMLLETCAGLALHTEAWAVFEDMVAMGIRPGNQAFYHLLSAMRLRPIGDTWHVWDALREYGVRPDERLYERLILRLTNGKNLELALQYIAEMGEQGLSPTLKTVQSIINLACHYNSPKLALELAQGFEESSIRRLDSQTWMKILIASSESFYADGIRAAWDCTVKKENITPDEGCCVNVLHTAGRRGLSSLGLDALMMMRKINVVWQEHHFAPVVEAFCNEGNIREAFGLIELMRESDIPPTAETAYPIFRAICTDVDKVDEAFSLLETLKEEGHKIDVAALNVVIQACVGLGDLQRALGTYRAAADLGVEPSVDTYNTLLSACVATKHRELGDRLLEEMRGAKIKPNARTYERLIVLCLTQPTYEDAFYYLEDMKANGLQPPQNIYEALIRRCVSVGDTRYKLAVEEMLEHGYEMPQILQAFIESGGQEPERPSTGSFNGQRRRAQNQPNTAARVDEAYVPDDIGKILL